MRRHGDENPRFASPLELLTALDEVLVEPHRLIDVLYDAADEDQAVAALAREFQLSNEQASGVLDQQIMSLTRFRRAEIGDQRATEQAAADAQAREGG